MKGINFLFLAIETQTSFNFLADYILRFAGPIPKELGALFELMGLSLYNNGLTGERRGSIIFCVALQTKSYFASF